MNQQTTNEIQRQLDSRESVLWSGQPRQRIMLRGSDLLGIPFSMLWGGFAIFWEYSAFIHGAPPFFLLFGVVFVAIGLYLIVGRFYVDAKQRARTVYAVTTDRVLIISGLGGQKIQSLALRTLSDVSLTESKDGFGSISFGNSFPLTSLFGGMSWPGMGRFSGPRLDTINNSKQVYQIIREAQKNAT